MLTTDEAKKTLPWVLEVIRLHTVTHFARDNPKRVLPTPERFSSLAGMRADAAAAERLNGGEKVWGMLSQDTVLVRRPNVRVVLLMEDSSGAKADGEPEKLKLRVGREEVLINLQHAELLHFCLALFDERASQGRPF